MKYVYLATALVFLLSPLAAQAHMSDVGASADMPGFMMMQRLEDEAIGDDAIHEEMEDLMAKMMLGSMSDAETNRMIALMQEYPSPSAMMFVRQSLSDGGIGQMLAGQNSFGGMMGGGWGNYPGQWAFWVTTVLVWVLLLLSIALLGQKLQKK